MSTWRNVSSAQLNPPSRISYVLISALLLLRALLARRATLGLDPILVARHRAGLSQNSQERRLRVLKGLGREITRSDGVKGHKTPNKCKF